MLVWNCAKAVLSVFGVMLPLVGKSLTVRNTTWERWRASLQRRARRAMAYGN